MSSSKLLSMRRHAYALSVGTVAGVTSGLVGWGGAQIIIPSMLYPSPLASYSQLSATGISLSSLSFSSCSSGYRFWVDNQVNVPLALSIGLPAVLSARVGTHLAKKLSGDALELFFNGFSLLLIPTHLWVQRIRHNATSVAATHADTYDDNANNIECSKMAKIKEDIMHDDDTFLLEESTVEKSNVDLSVDNDNIIDQQQNDVTIQATISNNTMTNMLKHNPLLMQHASFGLFSGVLSSLMGVGGLPLMISYLTVSTDLSHHEVQGTAVVTLIPAIIMSAASRMSVIPVSTTACVAGGAFGGGLFGAKIALDLSEEKLRYLFMGSLCLFGGINMFRAAGNIQRICSKML